MHLRRTSPLWAALLAGCSASTVAGPLTPLASSKVSDTVGRLALVQESAPAEALTSLAPTAPGRARMVIRLVRAAADRVAQTLSDQVRKGGSIKIFISVGGRAPVEADYGEVFSPIPMKLTAINLEASMDSAEARFNDLPIGNAMVTAYAYDGHDGMGNTVAEARANVNLVSGLNNPVRLSFVRSGEPKLLGVYEQVTANSTASVDAAPTGAWVTLHVEDILEPNAPEPVKIFVGGVKATNLINGLSDFGRGSIQFKVENAMTKGKIELVNGGATASLQPMFKRISRFTITPDDVDVPAGTTKAFVGKSYDTDNVEFVPQNPRIQYRVWTDNPDWLSSDPQSRPSLGSITEYGGLYSAPSVAPSFGVVQVFYGLTGLSEATASVFF
ncbi:MAG: hypothetical protein VKO21_06520 [Candidatus Sericytochromatia bacterium]|nr:hypothetical protein [Candidatus Sericytochromatia bacterium]